MGSFQGLKVTYFTRTKRKNKTTNYYLDTSVLLENTPLAKFIQNYIRDPSAVFLISSLMRMFMTSLPAFSRLFVQTVSKIFFVYTIKRKSHGSLKI